MHVTVLKSNISVILWFRSRARASELVIGIRSAPCEVTRNCFPNMHVTVLKSNISVILWFRSRARASELVIGIRSAPCEVTRNGFPSMHVTVLKSNTYHYQSSYHNLHNYLHRAIFLIFLPVCIIRAIQNFVWRDPLAVIGRSPLCGDFCHHCLLSKINL